MAQRALPYEYEIQEGTTGLTAMGGLPTYLDLALATGFLRAIERHTQPASLTVDSGSPSFVDIFFCSPVI